jgi:hypothetical protein
MEIPLHVQTELKVGSPISEDELSSAADAWPFTQSVFGLVGKEFTVAAVDLQAGNLSVAISQPRRVNLGSWMYLELTNNGVLESWALTTPQSGIRLPPTEVGQALVKAWFKHPAIIAKENIPSGLLVRGVAGGATLIDLSSRLATQWADVCFLLDGSPVPPAWVSKSEMDVLANARLTSARANKLNYEHLFLEAVSEFKTKWRFLSLYRILEHGYLAEIFQTLESAFFSSPKESLVVATKSAENELQQFLALAENALLQNHFEAFFDEFEKQKAGGNQLAHAIERSIQQNKQQNQVNGKSQMGVLVCYKMRCSIVHAGLSAPIFDAYPDGPALLESVLPIFESATLNFLGVTVS